MPDFSPRRRAEAAKAKKKAEAPKANPQKDPAKSDIIARLQAAFGNKGTIEMLIRGKFDVQKASKETAGPEMMAKFVVPNDPIVAEGAQIFMEQLTAYHQFVGAYEDYVEQIRKNSAYGLFWKYQDAFQNFGRDIVKDVLMPGVDDLIQLLTEQLPQDDAQNDMMKILQKVQGELRSRENGEDVKNVNKKVSSQTDISKSRDGAQLEKTISENIDLSTPPEEYIKSFLKNNGILIETLEKSVREEVDKKRSELTDKPIEKSANAAEGSEAGAAESSESTPVAAAAGANKP